MPLYPKNRSKLLNRNLFKNPSAEYRGAPFWSWNCKLDRAQLLRQIDHLQAMGFGGGHIHSRTGLATPYLGGEFMEHVRACTQYAKSKNMLTWLYDEDRWPSGFGGGLVTKDPVYRERYLLFTHRPYGSGGSGFLDPMGGAGRMENGKLLWRYAVELNADGTLKHYRLLKAGESPRGKARIWYAYLETCACSSWYNHQTSSDVLSRTAIEKFVEVTHEAYKKSVGDYFGKSIPAIFTDEPHFTPKRRLQNALEETDIFWPFTDDLPQTYFETYHRRIEETFPEVIWDLPAQKASLARYRYHDHVAERFAEAYADTLGNWCKKNGIMLTGHMVAEPNLASQTTSTGDIMRPYRAFDLPGIDMLCDRREYTTAKQAQSVSRQSGNPGVMSELYGVTGWHFDFVGHKGQGDWQAALGVTLRVPHLTWVSMAGEAKRDYPATFGYQSPWYTRYGVVENHFARLGTVLTRGKPIVRVAVLHPIESFWLCFGPKDQSRHTNLQREEQFKQITEWLLFGGFDFDFICEALLPGQCPKQKGSRLNVGQMAYEVVVVPGLRTIRSTTLQRLEDFSRHGGRVVFVGEIPSLVDAVPSARAHKLAAKCCCIPFENVAILQSLEEAREVRLTPPIVVGNAVIPAAVDPFLYQLRSDGARRHLFICNTERERSYPNTLVQIHGTWKATLLDTATGQSAPIAAEYRLGWTNLLWDAPAHGSILLQLDPGRRAKGGSLRAGQWDEVARVGDPVKVTLSEPNVLLLDQAQWRALAPGESDVPWEPIEEILRVDVAARERLGIPVRSGKMAQPWADTRPDEIQGVLELRFPIVSDVEITGAMLAAEEAQEMEIFWNGVPVAKKISGYFTDEAIQTLPLPTISAAAHELLLRIPMKRTRNVEWCYLLGDFGVHLSGRHARLTAPVRTLAWGDWTKQGLPFYGGNVIYHCQLDTTAMAPGELAVDHRFSNPLLDVAINQGPAQAVAFAPFRAALPAARGRLAIDITAYGNRANCFGSLHDANKYNTWFGPPAWRTTGDHWSLEYQLRPMGILVAPIVKQRRG